MSKVISCIPVKGRRPLVKWTIHRLLTKNGVWKVICSGDDPEDEKVCRDAGAEWVYCDNVPLSRKWNRAFFAASMYDPDYYLFMGSSDFISDNWVERAILYMDGYDMSGKLDMYLCDVGRDNYNRLCHWPGYDCHRKGETIGIGRLLSARIMQKLNYAPFDAGLNGSLDYSMMRRIGYVGGTVKVIEDKSMMSLSISHHDWPNKHQFNDHWNDRLPSERIEHGVNDWISTHFPEIMML